MDPKYLREKNEEEIDIIELFKRVKEGKAPNKILFGTKIYELFDRNDLEYMYYYKDNNEGNVYWFEENTIRLETKIKILDKPIIEEIDYRYFANLLETTESEKRICACLRELNNKINKIIRHLNNN